MFESLFSSFNFTAIQEEIVDAHHQVMAQLPISASTFTEGPSMIGEFTKFVQAVEWTSEPFFAALLAFHLFMYVLAFLLTRRKKEEGGCGGTFPSSNRIMLLICVIFMLVFAASYLNELGSQHHEVLFYRTKVNYFDTHGIFVSAVYSGPLTILAFLLQCRLIFTVFGMMVGIKQMQLKQQSKKKEGGDDGGSGSKKGKVEGKKVKSD